MEDYEQDQAPAADNEAAPAEVDESERLLVAQWCDRVKQGKKHHAKTFKQMRANMDLARLGASKEWVAADRYTVPILARHINQAVAVLYAKNPKVVAERRKRLMYRLWDGRKDTLQAAMETAVMGDMNAIALLQEVVTVEQQNLMLDRMGKTVELLWQYYLDEQAANYKQQIKSAVRRAKICKVAWIKLGFQRMLEKRPEKTGDMTDATGKLAEVEKTLAKIQADKVEDESAEMAQLEANLTDLQNDPTQLVREGPVLSFPRADQIIVDPECLHLKSLGGAGWVAEEWEMTPDEILSTWQVDIGSDFKWYAADGNPYDKSPRECKARVYEIWDKTNQQTCIVVEGYPRFIERPATPKVWMERFWPYFPIVFNEVEHYEEIYPQSDVEHGKHIQAEYNRSREALREHRIAARPYYVTAKGLEEGEKDKLAHHAAHAVIEMPTLATNQKVEDLIQRGPAANIDPNLYEVEMIFQDLLRAVGTQEANLGGLGGGTATENSIAEQSRSASQSDNVDDLDSVLTELARAGGQVMLLNLQKATVEEIVGPGAVWPDAQVTREEAAAEIVLRIEAGSSGRPNRAAELANVERATPLLIQIPDINPTPLARKYGELLDIDMEEMIAEGMPSITAMNALVAKAAAGSPTSDDPNQQGAQGANNAPAPAQEEPGPQPGYPTPMPA